MFQGIADDPGNYDLEACGELLNPEEVRGKICVVTRGSCFFSSKTLACQRAGAVAAIIVNDAMDEGAADNWVTSHDPAGILIPTVSYGAVQGNQLLREMDTSAAVTVKLHSYACEPAGHCVACAPGFGFPEDNCTSAACPGVDDSRSTVCNNRGTCDVDPVNERAFACTCDPGFSGDACEIEPETEDGEETALTALSKRGPGSYRAPPRTAPSTGRPPRPGRTPRRWTQVSSTMTSARSRKAKAAGDTPGLRYSASPWRLSRWPLCWPRWPAR